MSVQRILKAKNMKWIGTSRNGLQYNDPIFTNKTPDIGLASCYDGKYLITWGLNITEKEIPQIDSDYIWFWNYSNDKKVRSFERIIGKI